MRLLIFLFLRRRGVGPSRIPMGGLFQWCILHIFIIVAFLGNKSEAH